MYHLEPGADVCRNLTFYVNQSCINRGKRSSSTECPIALAIQEAMVMS